MLDQISHWANMGGYAGYIWSAYSLVLVSFFAVFFRAKRLRRLTQKQLLLYFQDQ